MFTLNLRTRGTPATALSNVQIDDNFENLYNAIGNISSLLTTEKTSTVGAINELATRTTTVSNDSIVMAIALG